MPVLHEREMIMTKQMCNRFRGVRLVAALAGAVVVLSGWLSSPALAGSAKEIDAKVDEAILAFEKEVKGGKSFLESSKGILVFPRVFKGGAGFGGEYGEGALRVGGKTVDYYSTLQGSFGLQLGGEIKTVFVVFLEEGALKRFQESKRWKAGVDGSVSLITLGTGGCHRYAEYERPDRRIRLESERVDVQPVIRRYEIHEAE